MAKLGLMLMPPDGPPLADPRRRSRRPAARALRPPSRPRACLIEPDDGKPGGWTHREFAQALGRAVGTNPRDRLVAGAVPPRSPPAPTSSSAATKAKLTTDRAAYFSHRNWVVDPKLGAPPGLWQPQIPTEQGLKETARWYREKGGFELR